jgi:hypothetical protein
MAIRYTQAERTGYVDAFKASGLSQTVFCKTQNISFKSFNNWVRLDSQGRLKKCSSSSDSWAHHLKSAPLNQSLMRSDPSGATEEFRPENALLPKGRPHFIPVQLAGCAQVDKDYSAQTSTPCEQEISRSIPIKTKGFCVDLPLDLLAPKNAGGVKMLLKILHKLPLKHPL